MDLRTRFIHSLKFDTSVPPLFWHMFGLMPGVLERWHSEGLPYYISEEHITEFFGFDGYGWLREMVADDGKSYSIRLPFPCSFDPPFEPCTIENTDHYIIRRDEMGRITKIVKGVSTLPVAIDHPIKKPYDWERLKSRLQYSKSRLEGVNWLKRYEEIRSKGLPVAISLSGFFDFPRNLMGERTLFRAYFESPGMIRDILETYSDLIVTMAEEMLESIIVDAVSFTEDMAYKHGPMISPIIFREFLLPHYRKVIDCFYHAGTRIFCVDTDGNLDMLIPLLIEAGINVVGPVEVQAGNNIVNLRCRFGTKIAFFGGLDKRALIQNLDAIDLELESKLPTMLKTGGYSIGLDHRVLSDTPLKNFEYYVLRVKKIIADYYPSKRDR